MTDRGEHGTSVPYDNLAAGIAHGPYPAAPAEIVELYMAHHHAHPELEPTVSDEQKRADIESYLRHVRRLRRVLHHLR